MSRRQRFLGLIADPQIAYLLLTLGTLGLTIELWSPGAILPGVVGGVSLLLAFFAFQIVPVNLTGLLLILLGLGLVILELKVPSFGALGIGGAVSLLIGSLMVTREVPGVQVSLGLIVPVVLVLSAGMLLLGRMALRAQRQPAVMGVHTLIGRQAQARSALGPDVPGLVDVHGELWRANCAVPTDPGARVRITQVDGLTLTVVPDSTSAPEGDSAWKA